jgi:predicted Rossmann fold nucleotide-binding protein DprA/Smf involved in DNA uptake
MAADALAEQTGLPAAQVSVTLMMLELKHLVARRMDGAYEAIG